MLISFSSSHFYSKSLLWLGCSNVLRTRSAFKASRYYHACTPTMMALSDSISSKAKSMVNEHNNLVKELNDLSMSTSEKNSKMNQRKTIELSKKIAKLSSMAKLYEKLNLVDEEKIATLDMIEETKKLNDQSMERELYDELERIDKEIKILEDKITTAVLPVEEDDYYSDAILELRSGTGGDEAAIFAKDLLDCYEKNSKTRGWSFETLSSSKSNIGGIREAVISISSPSNSYITDYDNDEGSLRKYGPYGYFKYESGVHRVQRVPINDVRIHTSTASVGILPATPSSEEDVVDLLPMSELKIETMRSSGAGGQHVNTTDSAVRITHLPTGITASIQDERSQYKNKAKALKLITARVRDKQKQEEIQKLSDEKKALMGRGQRNERIRTYNYPQDRVTDHRVKHTEHGIETLLNGDLVSIFSPLLFKKYRDELLESFETKSNNTKK